MIRDMSAMVSTRSEQKVDYDRIRANVKRAFSYNDSPNYRSPMSDWMTIRPSETRHKPPPTRSPEEKAAYQVYAKETKPPGFSREPEGHEDGLALAIRRRIVQLSELDQLMLGYLYSAQLFDKRRLKNEIWELVDTTGIKAETKAIMRSMIDSLLPSYRDNLRFSRDYPGKPYLEFGISADNWKCYRKYWIAIRNLIAEIDEEALEAVDR